MNWIKVEDRKPDTVNTVGDEIIVAWMGWYGYWNYEISYWQKDQKRWLYLNKDVKPVYWAYVNKPK